MKPPPLWSLTVLLSALSRPSEASYAGFRPFSSYCVTASLPDASTLIPYEMYSELTASSPLSLGYCTWTSPSGAVSFPSFSESMCSSLGKTWIFKDGFEPSADQSTQDKYYCAAASVPADVHDGLWLAVISAAQKSPDWKSVAAIVRSTSLHIVGRNNSKGHYLLQLRAGPEDVAKLRSVFDFIQPSLSELRFHPQIAHPPSFFPEISTLSLKLVGMDIEEARRLASDLNNIVRFLPENLCADCKFSAIDHPSTPSLSISGLRSLPSDLLSSLLSLSPKLASHLTSVTMPAPNKLLNANARWITQSGNITTSDPSTNVPQLPFFEHGITGSGIVVGVADSGLDYTSCFFWDEDVAVEFVQPPGDDPRIFENLAHRKVVQYVAFASDQEGENTGHGTHVCGSVAGTPVGALSTDDIFADRGMAPDAKLAFFDIGVPNAEFLSVPGNVNTDLVPYAARVGARIHSNSWGSDSNSYTGDAEQFDQYMFEHQDMLVLVAAGNSGGDAPGGDQFPGSLGSPATSKNCLAVGATENPTSGERPGLAYFSSRGPSYDGRIKPDVCAPGFSIQSARSISSPTDGHCETAGMAGTSMATPVTAGNTALVEQYFLEGWYPSGKKKTKDGFVAMGALKKAVLVNGAQRMSDEKSNFQSDSFPNNDQGHGIIELDQTLTFDDDELTFQPDHGLFVRGDFNNMPVFASTDPITDPPVVYEFKSKGSLCGGTDSAGSPVTKEFRATLAWHDYPGETLVNDLDIVVTGSDGSTHHPNGKNGRDSVNNVESVRVADPVAGVKYTVTISAVTIAKGPQPYALVVSGCFASPDKRSGKAEGGLTPTVKLGMAAAAGVVGAVAVGALIFFAVRKCKPSGGGVSTFRSGPKSPLAMNKFGSSSPNAKSYTRSTTPPKGAGARAPSPTRGSSFKESKVLSPVKFGAKHTKVAKTFSNINANSLV